MEAGESRYNSSLSRDPEILEVMLLRRVPGATMKCCYSSSDWLAKPKVEARKAECGRPHRAHCSSWLIRPEKVRKAECGWPHRAHHSSWAH